MNITSSLPARGQMRRGLLEASCISVHCNAEYMAYSAPSPLTALDKAIDSLLKLLILNTLFRQVLLGLFHHILQVYLLQLINGSFCLFPVRIRNVFHYLLFNR